MEHYLGEKLKKLRESRNWTQAQLREFLAVDFGACHEDALRDELAVDGVPVDIFRVPVLGLLLAEDQPQGVGLAGRGDDQDQVVLL